MSRYRMTQGSFTLFSALAMLVLLAQPVAAQSHLPLEGQQPPAEKVAVHSGPGPLATPLAAPYYSGLAPTAMDDSGASFTTDEDTPFNLGDVLANDSDPESDLLTVQSYDASGLLGQLTWTPTPAGSLDTTFSGDGLIITTFGSSYDGAFAVALQADGKIVAAGAAYTDSNYDFALVRYNSDGSLDTTFSGDGLLITAVGSSNDDGAYAVAIQADGKIVAAGYAWNGSNYDFALARYNPDGSLDTTFSGDGLLTTDFSSDDDDAHAVAVQADGRIVVAGNAETGSYDDFALARYNPDGSLDTTFSGDGLLTTAVGSSHDVASDVAVQPDGKIIVAGYARIGSNYDFALVRYNPDGSLDTTFSGDGLLTTNFGSGFDQAYALAVQVDGKIVAAGYTYTIGNNDFALAHYNPDGSLDATFSGDGLLSTAIGSRDDVALAVAVQADGKIVAAGYAYTGSNNDFALARYTVVDGGNFTYNPNGQFDGLANGETVFETFSYVVSDGTLTDSATVTLTINGLNDAPVLAPIGHQIGYKLTEISFTAIASNPELSDTLTFSLDAGAPDGAAIDPVSGDFTWTPTEAQGPGLYPVTVRVTDNGSPALNDFETFTITVNEVNLAPVLGVIGNQTVTELTLLSFTATATDANLPANTLTFSLDVGAPVGAVINPVTGAFTWTPTEVQGAGIYPVTVRVTDNGSPALSDFETLNVTVNEVNLAPVLDAIDDQTVNELALLSFTATAMDADRPANTLTFSLDEGAPDGAVIDSVTGAFSWTPTEAQGVGVYPITVRVTDNGSPILDDSKPFTITIKVNAAAPTAVDDSGTGFTTDEATPLTLGNVLANDSDPESDPLTVISYDAGGLLGQLTWIPTRTVSLDTTFSSDGLLTPAFGNGYAYAVAVQADGRIVAAGYTYIGKISGYDFALARYNPDGSLDTTFSGDGWLTTNFSNGNDYAQAVVVQADGKIVAAGYTLNGSNYDFALARYNPNGSLDTTFSSDGLLTTNFGSGHDLARAVAVQPDGKIVAAGYTYNGSNHNFALARYNPDGSLDTTFNGDGLLTTAFGSSHDAAQAVAVQADGKIVAAGYAFNGSNHDFALVRYNPDGSLDTTFSGDGLLTTAVGSSNDYAYAMAVQPDGGIVAAGYTYNGSNDDFALARYNPDGSLDITFSGDGKLTNDFGSGYDHAQAVAVQADGKIVAAGSAYNGSNIDFALARYNLDGSLDTTFNGDGLLTIDFDSGNDGADAVALQADGKIVAAGSAFTGSNSGFALVRYTVVDGGSFTYNPNGQFEGLANGETAVETFSYVASDGTLTDTATVTLTINGLNDAPVLAAIGNQSGDELTTISFAATANDPDLSNTLTFSLDAGAPAGAVIDPTTGAFTWTPAEAQGPGIYPVTVRVTDNGSPALDDFETFTITVNEVNLAPGAADDTYTTAEDTILTVSAPGVLANDSDEDLPAQALTAVLDTPPALGELALAADGSFVYTPALNFNGTVTFTYLANDGVVNSNLALVVITVGPVNDAPVPDAGADQTGSEGQLMQFNGSYTDPGLLSIQTVSITWDFGDGITTTGTLTPTHTYADDGVYTVTLTVDDGEGGVASDTLLVTVENVAPELAPIADQDVIINEMLTLTEAYTDPGWLDTHTALVDWGDGFTDTIHLAAGLTGFDFTHAFDTAGVYLVTVTITDDDGGVGQITFAVTVRKISYNIWLPIITRH